MGKDYAHQKQGFRVADKTTPNFSNKGMIFTQYPALFTFLLL